VFITTNYKKDQVDIYTKNKSSKSHNPKIRVMSSHHIVREKQEPALLVLGLETFNQELLGQLLEWSPTVIATIDTAEKLNSMGIKVDRILAAGAQNEVVQSDIKYLLTAGLSPLDAAMQFLIAEKYGAVNVILDDIDLHYFEKFVSSINLVIFHQQRKIYPVASGFSKWLPAGEVIEIHSAAKDLRVTGLEKTGADRFYTTHDGVFTIRFNNPFLLISEML
jgi:thiamine pyrophosphokinase